MAKNQDKKNYRSSSAAFVGCAVLGFGIGELFGQAAAGSAIGVGVGFLVSAFLR